MTRRMYFWILLGLFNLYLYYIAPNTISLICVVYCSVMLWFVKPKEDKEDK